jgi:hypothetical protein
MIQMTVKFWVVLFLILDLGDLISDTEKSPIKAQETIGTSHINRRNYHNRFG